MFGIDRWLAYTGEINKVFLQWDFTLWILVNSRFDVFHSIILIYNV